jgi:TolA-binding protein
MTPVRCDRGWEAEAYRDRRLGPKDVESFERHRRTCVACADRLARDERLRALGRSVVVADLGELAVRRLRVRILRDVISDVPARSSRSWRWVACASSLGMALLVIVSFVVARSVATTRTAPAKTLAPGSAPLAGAVAPGAGAVWTQTRDGGEERVELQDGTLRVHVRPQGPGERFFVRLPDGEIEVRGTMFEVTALGGSTRHVGVDEGTVVLRLRGSPDRSLGPGTNWSAPESPASNAHEVTAVRTPPSAPATPRRHSANGNDRDERSAGYVDAMQMFREGRYDGAAVAFHAFALDFPRVEEAEDASFLEALSLARAGRPDAAALAAERHLESFPSSFHGREASILVARAASRRGRCDEAIRVLAPWTEAAPDAEIQSVLVACGDGGKARR